MTNDEFAVYERLRERCDRYEAALREILVGKVREDTISGLGDFCSMAARFMNIARAALEPSEDKT